MLTQTQRQGLAAEIIEAMREAYEEEGIEGDFDDGYRYLVCYLSDEELECEYDKWVEKAV